MTVVLPASRAFQLPAALLSQGFALRPETDADLPFLQALYASTRAEELARAIGWSDAQKAEFVRGQFAAQRHHYRTHFADADYDILEHRGAPAGRLYLETRATQLHVIDIVLIPQSRSKGVGTAILTALIEQARGEAKSVGIFVEKFNPALRLYQRLGFTPVRDTEIYLEMEWTAGSQAKVAQ